MHNFSTQTKNALFVDYFYLKARRHWIDDYEGCARNKGFYEVEVNRARSGGFYTLKIQSANGINMRSSVWI